MARPAQLSRRMQAALYYARKNRLKRLRAQQAEETPPPDEE